MTTRKITAEKTGPVTIDASLYGHGGAITVRAESGCERATLTVTTADETGPAADAVRDATLRQSATGLYACVDSNGGAHGSGATTVITNGGRNVFQSVNNVNSSVIQVGGNFIGGNIVAGDVTIVNGQRITSGATVITGSAPVNITAVVPEGSSVIGHTHAANVITQGAVLNVSGFTQSGDVRTGHVAKVTASTQSGDVEVEAAAHINVKTQSGDVRLGRTDVVSADTMSGDIGISDFGGTANLHTMSGDIRVHATAGGDLGARTMSGDVNVTATEAALNDDLDVRASSMSGDIRKPQRPRPDTASVRRRR